MKCVHIIKCAKVRALFAENKVRFARAEQLWSRPYRAVNYACDTLLSNAVSTESLPDKSIIVEYAQMGHCYIVTVDDNRP